MKYILGVLLLTILSYGEMKSIDIKVEGMTCPLCTMTIKKNLKKQAGVIKAKVLLNSALATVVYDDNNISISTILKAIEDVGYMGKIEK